MCNDAFETLPCRYLHGVFGGWSHVPAVQRGRATGFTYWEEAGWAESTCENSKIHFMEVDMFFFEDACAKYLGANLNKHPRLKIFDTCVLVVVYNIYLGMIRGGCLVAQSEMPLISLHLCPGIAALAQALVEVRLFTVKIFLCCHFPTFSHVDWTPKAVRAKPCWMDPTCRGRRSRCTSIGLVTGGWFQTQCLQHNLLYNAY